ncbi:DNA repair protein RecO [Methylococcus sp. EFPC2]|uniref:DNA repair protein RecO n=1 Tax=Methylococcus sp. EFPC2 TaxID=2812648 RepID=UPI0019687DC8|nr:DNA repair protein RecO [Methylococcus sp. EFPC2]QSA98338.1 DNA repair protein RecO [Methylococcus sp. EFPC2]
MSLQDAFLLHRRPYRETSLLLDLLTRDHGLISLVGKGVLRGRGLQGALLRPFHPLSVSWAGRSSLPALTNVESRGAVYSVSGKALFCGFYVNELVLRLLPSHDAHPGIFHLYEQIMERLQNPQGLEPSLRSFELALLDELGYGPDLLHDAYDGQPVDPGARYAYQAEVGVRRTVHESGSVSGGTLIALRMGGLSGADRLGEAKRLMRSIINHHLGGRPLKSRELFKFTPTT